MPTTPDPSAATEPETTLRVGFAMGGGVSLGTFCGVALAEALKLLILHGVDQQGKPFQRVEVDVFSGASAGALSLAAMLRYLLHRTSKQETEARDQLEEKFGVVGFTVLPEDKKEALIAVQVMQNMQEELWSKEISLDKLLPQDWEQTLKHKASLLDRGAVDDIAKRHIVDWRNNNEDKSFEDRRVLAKRVLFACTITNLTPMVADARDQEAGAAAGFVGLNDGMRSFTHRDMRVFDLNFDQVTPTDNKYPDRWCLYHAGDAQDTLAGDLRTRSAWAKIAATAIASGAFPLAFEPVVLRRKAFEYGPKLWNATFGLSPNGGFNGQDTFPFTFADGGALNNEPIREAFRLASFIDAHSRATSANEKFERLIVFVDPAVSETVQSFRVPSHQLWTLDEDKLRLRTSLERLLPQIGTLAGAFLNEAQVVEADKIFQTRDLFNMRDEMGANFRISQAPEHAAFQAIVGQCEKLLKRRDSDEMIPAEPLTLDLELERVCAEEDDLTALRGGAKGFLSVADMNTATNAASWWHALNLVLLDLALGLEGKSKATRLVAIAPFHFSNTPDTPPSRIPLPGGQLKGFAGFMSKASHKLEFAAARYCAEQFLGKCELLPDGHIATHAKPTGLPDGEKKVFADGVRNGLDKLADRSAAMVAQLEALPSWKRWFSGLFILNSIKSKIRNWDWQEEEEFTAEFRILIPQGGSNNWELGNPGGFAKSDSKPVPIPGTQQWALVTYATWDGNRWSGPFVKNDDQLDQLAVDYDSGVLATDRTRYFINLPSLPSLPSLPYSDDRLRNPKLRPNPCFEISIPNPPQNPNNQPQTLNGSDWELKLEEPASLDALLLL